MMVIQGASITTARRQLVAEWTDNSSVRIIRPPDAELTVLRTATTAIVSNSIQTFLLDFAVVSLTGPIPICMNTDAAGERKEKKLTLENGGSREITKHLSLDIAPSLHGTLKINRTKPVNNPFKVYSDQAQT